MQEQLSTTLDPNNFELLRLVSLEPLIAFKNPHDYWVDTIRLIPIGGCLGLNPSEEEKLNSAGFWYLHHLEKLSQAEIGRRTGLDAATLDNIGARLRQIGRAFHPSNTMTLDEQVEVARQKHHDEIYQLREELIRNNPEAGLFLARLAEIDVVDDDPEVLYRSAVQLGSGQAANDLGASIFRRKDHSQRALKEAEALFELAMSRDCTQASINIQIIRTVLDRLVG